jgi:hypothetical protein
MAYEPEMIRRQMQETRSSLAEKLETLEDRLVGAAEGVASAATETAGAVKATVQESVQTIHDAVDVNQHIQRQPLTALAASICAGFACGRLLASSAGSQAPLADLPPPGAGNGRETAVAFRSKMPEAASTGGRWLQRAIQSFEPELNKLKELAVGMAVGMIRDVVHDTAASSVKQPLTDLLNDVTVKLGGRPLPNPVVGEETAQEEQSWMRPHRRF